MSLKNILSKDDYNKSQRNRNKAWKYFIEIGLIPQNHKPYEYVLHHKDETLKDTNIQRYIEWNIEDLEVELYSKHSSHHNKGRKMSDETKELLRQLNLGENNHSYGKKRTKEQVQRIRDSQPYQKKVVCIETRTIYPSLQEASRQTGIGAGTICSICQHKDKSSKGYHFEYYTDDFSFDTYEIPKNRTTAVAVRCIELDRIYRSISEASIDLKLDRGKIGKCCRDKNYSVKGYHFEKVANS